MKPQKRGCLPGTTTAPTLRSARGQFTKKELKNVEGYVASNPVSEANPKNAHAVPLQQLIRLVEAYTREVDRNQHSDQDYSGYSFVRADEVEEARAKLERFIEEAKRG